jgi:hypothetical protein
VAAVSRDGSVIAVSDAGQHSIVFLATSARGRSRRAETVAVNYMTGERFEPPMSEDLREYLACSVVSLLALVCLFARVCSHH